MREAKLVRLSEDGKQVILALVETGEEIALPVDDRLRAALRGDRARLGQLEIQMESGLRPRDIQARIRSGESPESVAQVAQMPVDKVMAFAGPVLAERDHIATLAQRASVRRRGGEGPTRNLGTWVTERLRVRQVDPASAEWDAWRRDDGRWAVRVEYRSGDRDYTAMFAYDAPGRYAVPDDDEARWLVGEASPVRGPQPRERRLAAVSDDFDIAPDHVADSYEAGFEDALNIGRERHPADRRAERASERENRPVRPVHPVPSPDDEPTLITELTPVQSPPEPRVEPDPAPPPKADPAPPPKAEPAPAIQDETADAEAPKRKARGRGKRASVPSWDEIMFGKKAD
jgi:Protein of unknown function (DUF3071)